MIIVFPMLTDESISTNAIPGVCKALERFILIYELDAIMKITGWKIIEVGGKIADTARSVGSIVMPFFAKTKQESANLNEAKIDDVRSDFRGSDKDTEEDEGSGGKKGKLSSIEKTEKVFKIIKGIKDAGTVYADMPNDQALSVEPTYMMVNTTVGTRFVGIKVIPVPIKSKYPLAQLLTVDASMNLFHTIGLKIHRKFIRSFWALCRGLRVPFLKDRVITGDPEKDILWASTFHKSYVFCLLNYKDMQEDFFKNVGGIHKLHSIGWNSFVAMDEIGKRAIFCMKQFHGLCSTVPYQFIYSSLGKDHGKIYDKLEDVKKAASPFFKTSVSVKQIVGETKDIVSDYLKRLF